MLHLIPGACGTNRVPVDRSCTEIQQALKSSVGFQLLAHGKLEWKTDQRLPT